MIGAVGWWMVMGGNAPTAGRRLQALAPPQARPHGTTRAGPPPPTSSPPEARRPEVSVRLGRRPRGAARGVPIEAVLPAALDLLAACLHAGAPPEGALAAVADAFPGELGEVFAGVARMTALGAPIEAAWSVGLRDPRWSAVARALIRAHHSGAALTDVLGHLADDRRRALRSSAQAAAQRAGIAAVLPLGLCFLPAFVLVGVVPVVAGFAHGFGL